MINNYILAFLWLIQDDLRKELPIFKPLLITNNAVKHMKYMLENIEQQPYMKFIFFFKLNKILDCTEIIRM